MKLAINKKYAYICNPKTTDSAVAGLNQRKLRGFTTERGILER